MKPLLLLLLSMPLLAQDSAKITFYSGTGNSWKYMATLGTGRKSVSESDFNIFIDGKHFVLARAKHYFVTAKLPPGKHTIIARTGKKTDDKENAKLELNLSSGEHKFVLAQMFLSGFYLVQMRKVEMVETNCQQAETIAAKFKPLAAKHIRNRTIVDGAVYFPGCSTQATENTR